MEPLLVRKEPTEAILSLYWEECQWGVKPQLILIGLFAIEPARHQSSIAAIQQAGCWASKPHFPNYPPFRLQVSTFPI
jgi:hypothetical protein